MRNISLEIEVLIQIGTGYLKKESNIFIDVISHLIIFYSKYLNNRGGLQMKKTSNSTKFLKVISIVSIVVFFTGVGRATLADPGSKDDPLVTLSYVEKRMEQIKFYIDQKVQELVDQFGDSEEIQLLKEEISRLGEENSQLVNKVESLEAIKGVQGTSLEVVELGNGQTLIGKAGTEIILRGGKAKAIVSELGGLSDVTGGTDIGMNQNIPLNHLLIIPRNDGRGVYVEEYAIFMVRGQYEIK